MIQIRRARIRDLKDITEIYNKAILETVATFDSEVKTIEEQKQWFKLHDIKYPIIVAKLNEKIIGWASLSKWSDRCAYSDTAEVSLYVKKQYQGQGIGTKLLEKIIKEGEKSNLHAVIARITEGNKKSIHIHKSVGFFHIGVMKEVGYKFGELLDVYLMEKIYSKK